MIRQTPLYVEDFHTARGSMKKPIIILLAMNPSQRKPQLTWLHSFLMLFLFTIFSSSAAAATSVDSYSDHCASVVPESTPTLPDNTIFQHFETHGSHYTGGDRILGKVSSHEFSFNSQKSFSFRPTQNIFKTNTSGVYKIQASLRFRTPNYYDQSYYPNYYGQSYYPSNRRSRRNSLRFLLNGFWSQDSGKLCMVGSSSASWYSNGGNHRLNLEAVLKLSFTLNSTIATSLVTGTLESLSSSPTDLNYFEPISLLAFTSSGDYKYTLVPDRGVGCPPGGIGIDIPKYQSLGLRPRRFCSMLWRPGRTTFKLEYTNECTSSLLKNCTPLGQGIKYLPRVMSLNPIECSEDEHKVRCLVGFGNDTDFVYYQPFDPTTTLVAEGSWDGNKNRLCIVACRILNSTDSMANANVGDCSIRLSLRYPAIWSIRNTASVVGEIWTNKTVNESGYFNRIMFGSYENSMVGVPGLRYEYTETERVRKSCPIEKPVKRKGDSYPNGNSYDMRFDLSVNDSMGKLGWGYAVPIFVGDQSYAQHPDQLVSIGNDMSEVETNIISKGPLNISYMISISNIGNMSIGNMSGSYGNSSTNLLEISAEGVYDDETGHLCMVGCRKLDPQEVEKSTNESMDCELLLKFHFQPINAKNGGEIKGSIESMRENGDPLYFEHFNMTSAAFYASEATSSIWRMDLEIVMVLISNTLACVFVGLQLFYVKKSPDVLPFMSLVMLVILTLGHMIPLVLNFEALFLGNNRNQQNVLLESGGWPEVNEVIVRVVTMVAFLLQFRLLQLAWSARLGDVNRKVLWIAEKKALFVSLPLYIVGVLIALLMNNHSKEMLSSSAVVYQQQQHSLWGNLKSYGGLVLDGFLFPQILLNVLRISKEIALSPSFYIGTTFVRLLPHAYDLYRTHNYSHRHFDGAYIYANPSADFYSVAWDIIIPCVGVMFAFIIYFQQRLGGRCFLPRRLREAEVYEKVPVVSSDQ